MMSVQSRRLHRAVVCGALTLGLIAGPATFAGGAAAQETKLVDPNAPKAGQSPHDAALSAAARGDYIAAVDLAKKAAAEGHPLDADQVDFMTQKASAQQAILDDNAKSKASQAAAQATAQQIEDRQQKQYAERAKAKDAVGRCAADSQQTQVARDQVANRAAASATATGVTGPYTSEGGKQGKC
jgi:hypothetical protein